MSDFPENKANESEIPADSAVNPAGNTLSGTEGAANTAEPDADELSTVFSDPAEHRKVSGGGKKRRLRAIIASVTAVALLAGGTVAVVKLIPEKEEENTESTFETIKVLELDSDDLKTVNVTNKNGSFKLYSEAEKQEDSSSSSDTSSTEPVINWYLDGYAKDVINSYSVSSVADSAAKIEASREITAKTAEECGFNLPAVKADVVTNDGAEYSVLIGADSPDNTGVYLKLSTGDKIYLVESSVKESFEFDALSLAAADSAPGITVTDDMGDYKGDDGTLSTFDTITVKGRNFPETVVLAPNTDESLSQFAAFMTTAPTRRIADKVDSLFEIFKSGMTVSGAYSFDTSAAGQKKLGLDKPDFEAAMKAGPQSYTYRFKLQEDGGYAVWFTGCKLIGRVDGSSFEFLSYETSDFYASWVCLQAINELSGFTIKTADKTYSFDIVYDDSEDAEEDYVITYNGKKLVADYFQNFYQHVISLSCSDYNIERISGNPYASIIFTYSDKSKNPTTVEFRKASETRYQYSIDGINMGKITATSLNKILREVEKVAAGEEIK